MESLKKLANRGITFETNPSEFVRGSKGISMVDKAAGKTVIGIQAPTDKTLVSWLKQHQSYRVLLPAKLRGRGTYIIHVYMYMYIIHVHVYMYHFMLV